MPIIVPPVSVDTPVSLYVTWRNFVNNLGLNNILLASNKDASQQGPTNAQQIPKGQVNYYAVQNALNFATDKIHNILFGGILKVPLDFTPNGGVVPDRVAGWAEVIAFCRLLGMRTPDKIPATQFRRGGFTSAAVAYASMLEDSITECTMHKDGQWRQMPEAVHAVDGSPTIVRPRYGACRELGGRWVFHWSDCWDQSGTASYFA